MRIIEHYSFRMLFVYDGDLTVGELHCFSRKADDSLDKKCLGIAWISENDDIFPLRIVEMVGELVDDEVLAGFECGIHRCAGDDEGLGDIQADRNDDNERDDSELYYFFQKIFFRRFHVRVIVLRSLRLTQDLDLCHTTVMPYIIAGLGNPGDEYAGSRHNTGRIILEQLRAAHDIDDFKSDKKSNALIAKGKIGKETVTLVEPETFMNNSGKSLVYFIKSVKAAEKLIVIYDDFNLPMGKIRISFNRSSGGHNGVESVIKHLKTEAFVRVRIGVAPEKKDGNAKVPHGDDKIEKFILGKFKEDEMKELKKIGKVAVEAIETLLVEGKDKAMSLYNAG
jgi:PTH1 family peptidyl-tRNA hydrolase